MGELRVRAGWEVEGMSDDGRSYGEWVYRLSVMKFVQSS